MKYFCTAIVILAFALALSAQSPASVLKKAEKAMGGLKQRTAAKGWAASGTITDPQAGTKGRFTSRTALPNLYHFVYDLGGIEFERGFNGKSGWERSSRNGLQTLTGDASLLMQAEASYRNFLWLNYKKEKAKLVSGGKAMLAGVPVNVVRMNTPKGVEFKLFFDQATGLLVREEIVSGDAKRSFAYSDFRDVGPAKLPFRIEMDVDGRTLTVELTYLRPENNVAVSVFDFPRSAGEPLPDVAKLLVDVEANEAEAEKLLDQYSYTQRSTSRQLGKDGTLREVGSETYQLSFHKGNRIRRLIEKNGKPLTPREQAEADKQAGERVEEIEKDLAKREKREQSGPPSENSRRVSISEVMRASRLINPRRERFRGRDVIVFDFEPNPDFDYKNAKSMLKFFGKTAGVIWIDEKDKQVVRLEAYLADSFNIGGGVLAKLRKGASFTLEQERLNDEIWLPSLADINLSVRVLMVKGIDVNQEVRSYDYRKFATEVKDARIGEPDSN